jgi:hypothetical protein
VTTDETSHHTYLHTVFDSILFVYRHDDPTNILGLQQNLLPDLPDYETAVNDPRYAKKPPLDSATAVTPGHHVTGASIAMPPPPPYSVAIASEPLSYNFAESVSADPTALENEIQQSTSSDNATIEPMEEPLAEPTTTVATEPAPASPSTSTHRQSQSNDTVASAVTESTSTKIEVAPAPADSTN